MGSESCPSWGEPPACPPLAVYEASTYCSYQGSMKWASRLLPVLAERMAWRKPQQFTDLQPPGQADGGGSVCDPGCVKGCRRPVLPPSWFRETGGGEQGERWTLFLPNLVTWLQRNPDFPISSLNQVRWTKCKY